MTDTHKLVEELAEAFAATDGSGRRLADLQSHSQNTCRKFALTALTAIEASGYRVVPVEMTDDMRDAARHQRLDDGWAAALAAAPKVTP